MSAWSTSHKRRISPVGARVRDGLGGHQVGRIDGDAVRWVLVQVELDLVGLRQPRCRGQDTSQSR